MQWASEGVHLVKLRNGNIIQSADHEEWEDENEDFMEDIANVNVSQTQNIKKLETEEEEVRPFELGLMSEGKSALTARLKNGSLPFEIKALYTIGTHS